MDEVEWKCPRCQAPPDACGKKIEHLIGGVFCTSKKWCGGFVCECDADTAPGHGETLRDRCGNASCYHCGWGGTFPKMPRKMPAWATRALADGWTPPDGWTP
jgi:hypothetical protein